MAAPLFTDKEIAGFIQMPKRASTGTLNEDAPASRDTKGEVKKTTMVYPDDENSELKFSIQEVWIEKTDLYSISLLVKAPHKGWQAISRYDVQDNAHPNPEWFPPPRIRPGEPHRHIYSERSEREFSIWSKCATPIDLGNARNLSPKQEQDKMRGMFLVDMHIRFSSKDSAYDLFSGGI